MGQSSVPTPPSQRNSHPVQTNYFHSSATTGHDPFSQVGPGQPPPSVVPTFAPSQAASKVGAGTTPLPTVTSQSPLPPSSAGSAGEFCLLNVCHIKKKKPVKHKVYIWHECHIKKKDKMLVVMVKMSLVMVNIIRKIL